MLIADARLVKNAEEKLVNIQEVSKLLYDTNFRGFLYCPTPGCPAKLLYINSDRAHFRTWKYHLHLESCVYHIERRWVDRDYQFADVTDGFEFQRRQVALSRAYRAMRFPEEELPNLKTRNRTTVVVQKPTLSRRRRVTGIQTKLFNDEILQSLERKRPPLRRKYVSMINANDVGKHKLVMGFVQKVELIKDVAKITLLESDKEIDIVFERSFTAESKNSSYLNKFAVIQHLADQNSETAFTAIGEVRFNRKTNRFEHQIFFGTDFRIEDMDLLTLSAKMVLGELE
ncbi:hypothetical protein CSE16_11310 [Solibacillus sp. R5-41]|uniref:hypothetical protein n=1 Tax=Solibacillus sp. R5-41 TaxID=2048654 RepID=UPI000C1297C3|nr:hypothetical protein [Solibacillus sp. R5-41]ATP40590.1 hypothetical protein CSE16_11310 [Solibacillus sp. R5-41]